PRLGLGAEAESFGRKSAEGQSCEFGLDGIDLVFEVVHGLAQLPLHLPDLRAVRVVRVRPGCLDQRLGEGTAVAELDRAKKMRVTEQFVERGVAGRSGSELLGLRDDRQ